MGATIAVISLAMAFLLTSLRAIKVRKAKTDIIIDLTIIFIMTGIWLFSNAFLGAGICLLILIVWVVAGIIIRIVGPKLELWLDNLLCKLSRTSPYRSYEELQEDIKPGSRLAIKLLYYAVELGLGILFLYVN